MVKSKLYSKIIYSDTPLHDLLPFIEQYGKNKTFLVTEDNVNQLWQSDFLEAAEVYIKNKLVIPSGEANKKIDTAIKIWEFLSTKGADRKSLLINLGGGMLTDLAGFAASTFKRGIDFINIPTTLLSQVDASVGGKTGINFNGLKNEVGTFREPVAVIIHTNFLKTIDRENFLSGYAEMIKHGLIHYHAHLEELKKFNTEEINYAVLQEIIRHSVEVKQFFVENDPAEQNIRKALNFGHTAGHALESLAMEQKRPVMHGYAVAWGMITELYLSAIKCDFPMHACKELSRWLNGLYGGFRLSSLDFDRLYELMLHDKKNEAENINFTLLSAIGRFEINRHCERQEIYEALDYFRNIK